MNIFSNTIGFYDSFGLVWLFIAFSISLTVSYFSYPVIIRVSKLKELIPQPNHRSSHSLKIPNLGGIGIFLALNVAITFFGNYFQDQKLFNLLGALTFMFFVGLVDDLISVRPKSKLIGQIVASLYIILVTDLRIESLQGLFGIYELSFVISVALTVLMFVVLINAYNLIDGVDGLAGGFAITVSVIFAIIYYLNANYSMVFLSVSIIGALTSFLTFNFSTKNKIFMGDTGSMIIGFLLAYQAVNFMSLDFSENFMFLGSKSVIYILAIFTYPLLDTIRVFFIRIKAGYSPFTADKNHIHHILLEKGLKHWEISLVVSLFTITAFFGMSVFSKLEINKIAFILGSLWFFTALIVGNLKLSIALIKSKAKNNIDTKTRSSENDKKGKIFYLKELAS